MSSTEHVVMLTLLKIFNWNQPKCSNLFQVSFFSLKTSSLILTKQIKGTISDNEVIFNYSLRVAYQPDQNEVIIKLSHFIHNKNSIDILGQFGLNLDHLAHKKLQFFPFGKNDKVLKIAADQKNSQTTFNNNVSSRTNEQFIREKEDFLRKFKHTPTSSRVHSDSCFKKSFSEQARDLLVEVQGMRQHKQIPQVQLGKDFNDYYQTSDTAGTLHQRGINKSNSETNFATRTFLRNQRGSGDDDSQKHSNRSQKHKLVLKNLEMVPCKNEYYEQYECKPERKSNVLVSNVLPPKRKLYNSQFY